MEIYEILSQLMKDRKLKVAEVSRLCDLPDGTVRGIIKRKQKDIALKVALKLSKGLGVSIEYLNGMSEHEKSPKELRQEKFNQYEHIIDKYHFISTHSPDGISVIDMVLDREHSIAKKLKEQGERIQKADMEISTEFIPMRIINYFFHLASSGTGQIIFDAPPTKRIEIPDIPDYQKVDYAIGVNGNSMEPLFHDGDMLLIEMTEDITIGDIGIFRTNNECYVKTLGETELISLNPNAKNIPLNESAGCMGKVIGKLPNK